MSVPTTLDPRQYADWQATPLGAITERLDLVFELAGPVVDQSVLDVGTLPCSPSRRSNQVTSQLTLGRHTSEDDIERAAEALIRSWRGSSERR